MRSSFRNLAGFSQWFLLLIFVSNSAVGINCRDLFVTAAKIERIKMRLQETKGVKVVEDGLLVRNFTGGYNRHEGIVALDPLLDNILKKVVLHHEAVHVTTDINFKNNPIPENAAMAIRFQRKNGTIGPNLPEGYKSEFHLDEVMAYSKGFRLVAQIGRFWKENGLESPEKANQVASEHKSNALVFYKASKNTLLDLRSKILGSISNGKTLDMQAFLYARNTPDHFIVEVTLYQSEGTPILVSLPIFDKTAQSKGGVITDLLAKLLEVCNAGIESLEVMSKDFLGATGGT